jgi:5-methylthioadenosine/S-adenosylhomocysteine deaminase
MSMVDEIYLASLLQKSLRRDPTTLPARQVLAMATIGGARALSWDDEIGSLEVGKRADLVLVDPVTANMMPVHDAVSALVTSMKTENIHSVMCDGRWLLKDRELTVADEKALLAEAQARAIALAPSPRPWPLFG